MHSVLVSSAIRAPSEDAGSPSEDAGLLSVISLDVRDPWGSCWPCLALVGTLLTSLRGLMNPPGSVSRVSVREPSNYEKVDRFYCTQHVLWKVVRDRPDPALTSIPDNTLAHQAHSCV
jgi:hypothetical protein